MDSTQLLLRLVDRVRVMAQSLGPIIPGGQVEMNHWSIYLLMGPEISIHINMTLANPWDEMGTLRIAPKFFYNEGPPNVGEFDLPAPPGITAQHYISLLQSLRRERYRMTSGGGGCRHWV